MLYSLLFALVLAGSASTQESTLCAAMKKGLVNFDTFLDQGKEFQRFNDIGALAQSRDMPTAGMQTNHYSDIQADINNYCLIPLFGDKNAKSSLVVAS